MFCFAILARASRIDDVFGGGAEIVALGCCEPNDVFMLGGGVPSGVVDCSTRIGKIED